MAFALMPHTVRPLSAFPAAAALVSREPVRADAPVSQGGFSGWMERTTVFPVLLCVTLGVWLVHHFVP